MDRGRGRTPHVRGRNSSMRWAPRSYDQSKHPQDPLVGRGICQKTSGVSFLESPVSQASHNYKQSSSSSFQGDDDSVKVTTYQREQSIADSSSCCSEEPNHVVASMSNLGLNSIEEPLSNVSKLKLTDGSSSSKSCPIKDGRKSYQQTSVGSFLHSPGSQASHYYKQSSSSSLCEVDDESVKVTTHQLEQSVPVTNSSSSSSKSVAKGETGLTLRKGDLGEHLKSKNPTLGHKTEETENPAVLHPYDIYRVRKNQSVVLKPSILERNRERRNEMRRDMGMTSRTLRPGMILLKGYISLSDQVKIVERCRQLGVGPGGFYQPGYREGTELHLKMMCLGKNWDPKTRKYGDCRPIDGAKPPNIPVEFLQLTEKAIRDSYALIGKDSERRNPEKILPWMSPDICIVNFYARDGRLGLHQDKDESEQSLCRGLPVVSFSIGDSADFLFGDERDVDKAQKVVLESGDVLIFGGESRNIFHGVTVIHSNTAPRLLLEDTNLRPGRLNLTLREC